MTLGDRLVVMDGGVVQQCASPREVYERPANRFVAGFVGTPSMNFLEGRMLEGRLKLPGGCALEVGARHRDRTEALVVGVRPDALRRAADPSEALLRGQLTLLEDLGDRCDLRFALEGGGEVLARRPASELDSWASQAGEPQIALAFAREDAHLFEPGPHGALCR